VPSDAVCHRTELLMQRCSSSPALPGH